MYPVQRSVRNLTGDAALLDDEGADKLLLDSGTRPSTHGHKLARQGPQGHPGSSPGTV